MKFLENLNKYWATPLLAIVGGVLGIYFTVVKNNLDKKTTELESRAMQIESELRQKEFENNIKFQMYKEVKDAISVRDQKIQEAVLLLVNEMLADDILFKDKLIATLLSSPNSSRSLMVEQDSINYRNQKFIDEQSVVIQKNQIIDVFYLEDIIEEARPRALRIVELLKLEYPGYEIRPRLLPRSINAKSSFRISANEIRYEPNEKEMAEKILDIINTNAVFSNESPRLRQIKPKKTTTNYISVFVRNM